MGAGAKSRKPLGLAVVGGLVVSQILTLYFTPMYYLDLDKRRFGRKTSEPTEPPEPVELALSRPEPAAV